MPEVPTSRGAKVGVGWRLETRPLNVQALYECRAISRGSEPHRCREDGLSDPKTITRLLHQCRADPGNPDPFDALMPLVYDDLRHLARIQLMKLRPGETLDTTALANESYLKLKDHADLDWNDRRHFFAVAARSMRQILVDYARRRMAGKRHGVEVPLDLERVPDTSEARAEQMLRVHELLERLEVVNQGLVQIVECRFFAGYTEKEIAGIMDISVRTVQRRWQMARGWLRELALEDDPLAGTD